MPSRRAPLPPSPGTPVLRTIRFPPRPGACRARRRGPGAGWGAAREPRPRTGGTPLPLPARRRADSTSGSLRRARAAPALTSWSTLRASRMCSSSSCRGAVLTEPGGPVHVEQPGASCVGGKRHPDLDDARRGPALGRAIAGNHDQVRSVRIGQEHPGPAGKPGEREPPDAPCIGQVDPPTGLDRDRQAGWARLPCCHRRRRPATSRRRSAGARSSGRLRLRAGPRPRTRPGSRAPGTRPPPRAGARAPKGVGWPRGGSPGPEERRPAEGSTVDRIEGRLGSLGVPDDEQ